MKDAVFRIGFLMLALGIVTANSTNLAIPFLLLFGGVVLMHMGTERGDEEE